MRIRIAMLMLAGLAFSGCGSESEDSPPFQQFAGGATATAPAPEAAPSSAAVPTTAQPADSPTAPATAAVSTATEPPAAGCTAVASVSNEAPARNATVVVTGRLECPGGSSSGAAMTASWKFKSTTSTCEGVADDAGVATCSRSIGGATAGFPVEVTVTFIHGGASYRATTGFTPR